jgi:hypothetical protein
MSDQFQRQSVVGKSGSRCIMTVDHLPSQLPGMPRGMVGRTGLKGDVETPPRDPAPVTA